MACAFGARIASPHTRSTLGMGCRTKCPAAFTLTLHQAFFVHLFHPLGNAYCVSHIRIFIEFLWRFIVKSLDLSKLNVNFWEMHLSWIWWFGPLISAFGELSQVHHKFWGQENKTKQKFSWAVVAHRTSGGPSAQEAEAAGSMVQVPAVRIHREMLSWNKKMFEVWNIARPCLKQRGCWEECVLCIIRKTIPFEVPLCEYDVSPKWVCAQKAWSPHGGTIRGWLDNFNNGWMDH